MPAVPWDEGGILADPFIPVENHLYDIENCVATLPTAWLLLAGAFLELSLVLPLVMVLDGRFDETGKQWMRCRRFRFELRMKLNGDKPRMCRDFNNFNQRVVRA